MKTSQVPPIRVTDDALDELTRRAKACGLTVSEYARYRLFGKRVLTGEQVDEVRKHEKLID